MHAQQLQAFRHAVRALDAGDGNAFGYWHYATLVAFGGTGDCYAVRDRVWRALRRCSPNAERVMYGDKDRSLAREEKRLRAEERAKVRSGWTYGRQS